MPTPRSSDFAGVMRLRPGLHRSLGSALAGIGLMALLATSCGGNTSDSAKARPSKPVKTTTTVSAKEQRPEGRWTFVDTTISRSDVADYKPGHSSVALEQLTPKCDTAPCDVDVTPAGANGTYLPSGVAFIDKPSTKPYNYTWNAIAKTYTFAGEPSGSSCTNSDGRIVQDAYTKTTSRTLTYRPAAADRPATMAGTYTTKVESTAAGLKDKCTPFTESGTVAATPTGALVGKFTPDLVGAYETTEVVTKVEPANTRTPGFTGSLGEFQIKAPGEGYALKGLIGEAKLAPDGDGFSGSTPEVEGPCSTTPETPKAFTRVEKFTDLAAIALTTDGDPILAGKWATSDIPTPVGVASNCTASTNTGYVVLVPTASLSR